VAHWLKAGQLGRGTGRIKGNGKKSPGKGTKRKKGWEKQLSRPADLFVAGPSMHENRVFFFFYSVLLRFTHKKDERGLSFNWAYVTEWIHGQATYRTNTEKKRFKGMLILLPHNYLVAKTEFSFRRRVRAAGFLCPYRNNGEGSMLAFAFPSFLVYNTTTLSTFWTRLLANSTGTHATRSETWQDSC
jgi:hypothetical protein